MNQRTTRLTTLALALLGAACGHGTATTPAKPPIQDAQPMPDPESWRSIPPSPACASAFAALRGGELSEWRGITGCSRRDAEDAFGPSEEFTGILGPGRRHLPEGTAPLGIQVSYQGDRIVAIALAPRWSADKLAPLGPPDDDGPSGDGVEYHQLTWAERGLIAHASKSDASLWIVVAFAPAPLDAVRNSSLFHLGVREHRGER